MRTVTYGHPTNQSRQSKRELKLRLLSLAAAARKEPREY
jgi:hypothetical protein